MITTKDAADLMHASTFWPQREKCDLDHYGRHNWEMEEDEQIQTAAWFAIIQKRIITLNLRGEYINELFIIV